MNPKEKQPLSQQEFSEATDLMARQTAEKMVIERYGSTKEDAEKWGYVKNTWQDQETQDAQWQEFVKEAMKGDPWRNVDGRDAF